MTPKSLLRHKRAVSRLDEMGPDTSFHRLLWDDAQNLPDEKIKLVPDDKIRRVVICSGKVYYDLYEEREKRGIDDIYILRIEQLYPFPTKALMTELSRFKQAEIVWCQEEPRNMGGWVFVDIFLEWVLNQIGAKHRRARYSGRPASASTAVGQMSLHLAQLKQFLGRSAGNAICRGATGDEDANGRNSRADARGIGDRGDHRQMVQESRRRGRGRRAAGRARNRQGDDRSAGAGRRRAQRDRRQGWRHGRRRRACSARSRKARRRAKPAAAPAAKAAPRRRRRRRRSRSCAARLQPPPKPPTAPLAPSVRKLAAESGVDAVDRSRHRQGRPRHQRRHAGGHRARRGAADAGRRDRGRGPGRARRRRPTMPRARSACA